MLAILDFIPRLTVYFILFLKAFVVFIDDGKVIFLAELITLITDLIIAFFIRLVALACYYIYIVEDDVIVNMFFVYVSR